MDTEKTAKPQRLHPLIAAAAVSVILVSLTGIAAMTGLLPNSHSTITPLRPPPPEPVRIPETDNLPAKAPVPPAERQSDALDPLAANKKARMPALPPGQPRP